MNVKDHLCPNPFNLHTAHVCRAFHSFSAVVMVQPCAKLKIFQGPIYSQCYRLTCFLVCVMQSSFNYLCLARIFLPGHQPMRSLCLQHSWGLTALCTLQTYSISWCFWLWAVLNTRYDEQIHCRSTYFMYECISRAIHIQLFCIFSALSDKRGHFLKPRAATILCDVSNCVSYGKYKCQFLIWIRLPWKQTLADLKVRVNHSSTRPFE